MEDAAEVLKQLLGPCDLREKISVDIGAGPLKRANIALDLTPTATTDIVADALHLPFRDQSVGFVYSAHCIEHVKDPFLMLSEIRRVLKVGGMIEVHYPRWKYVNLAKHYLRLYFIYQLPFIYPQLILDLFKYMGWRKHTPEGRHRFWPHPRIFTHYFQVDSVTLGPRVSFHWRFLQSMGGKYRGKFARWLRRVLPGEPMELVVKATRLT